MMFPAQCHAVEKGVEKMNQGPKPRNGAWMRRARSLQKRAWLGLDEESQEHRW